jgi:citrate synthase
VDFYTGLIYRAMGFPTDMFTVLFAIGRLPGWLAHYKEMLHDRRLTSHRARSPQHRREVDTRGQTAGHHPGHTQNFQTAR